MEVNTKPFHAVSYLLRLKQRNPSSLVVKMTSALVSTGTLYHILMSRHSGKGNSTQSVASYAHLASITFRLIRAVFLSRILPAFRVARMTNNHSMARRPEKVCANVRLFRLNIQALYCEHGPTVILCRYAKKCAHNRRFGGCFCVLLYLAVFSYITIIFESFLC